MATFGKVTDGASIQAYTSDRKLVSKFAPGSSGTVTGGGVRIYTTSAVNVPTRMVIYSDTANAPVTLLATSDETTWNSASEIIVTFTFSGANQISITSGTNYWIGVHYDYTSSAVNVSRGDTASLTKSNNDTYSDGAASTFGALATTNGPIDVYIDYTEPSGQIKSFGLLGVG